MKNIDIKLLKETMDKFLKETNSSFRWTISGYFGRAYKLDPNKESLYAQEAQTIIKHILSKLPSDIVKNIQEKYPEELQMKTSEDIEIIDTAIQNEIINSNNVSLKSLYEMMVRTYKSDLENIVGDVTN